jgi:hypothetical protein
MRKCSRTVVNPTVREHTYVPEGPKGIGKAKRTLPVNGGQMFSDRLLTTGYSGPGEALKVIHPTDTSTGPLAKEGHTGGGR